MADPATPDRLPPGSADRFRKVAVIGAGLMGRRLAGVFAAGGLDVVLTDARTDVLPDARREARAIAAAGSAGTISTAETVAEAVDGVDLVTEAVIEDLAIKQRLFADLAALNPTAVLASNSSVLPISAIAGELVDAGNAIGTHWWNPPDLIPVVEVVQGQRSSLQVVADVMALLESLGKMPVWVRRETSGFIGNRMQHALWREAIALVEEGVADAATVDRVVCNTVGLRLALMGPLENADYVGLDLTRAIHSQVFPALSAAASPSVLLDSLIAAGHLGAKSGQGFHSWPEGSRERLASALASHVSQQIRSYGERATQE